MEPFRRYNLIATLFLVLALLLALYLTKELLNAFLLSFFLAYAVYPIDRDILRISGWRRISSFLTMALIFVLIVFIAFAAVNALLTEAYNLLGLNGAAHLQTQISEFSIYLSSTAEKYLPPQAAGYLENVGDLPAVIVGSLLPSLRSNVEGFARSLPIYITQAMVAVFFTYYFLVDGGRFVAKAVELLPRREVTTKFLKELDSIYNALIRVFFVSAIIVAAIGSVGFFILGIPYPVLLGAITGLTAIVPMIGPAAIFVPVALYLLLNQDLMKAVLVLIFGVIFLVILPNNIIIPRLASRAASIHPLIALLAFTAPILVVGAMGVIIGPIVYGFILAAYRTMEYFR